MGEIAARIRTVWAVLRGKPVVRGVEFRYGEVSMRHRDDLWLSDGSIDQCQILTRGPVTIKASRGSTASGNGGDALVSGGQGVPL